MNYQFVLFLAAYAAIGALVAGVVNSIIESDDLFLPAVILWPVAILLGVGYLIFKLGRLVGSFLRHLA